MLGCDGGGSAMEQEPQQMEELKLSIYHPPESNAQTKSTITRDPSNLKSGDLLNIFVEGNNDNSGKVSEEKTGISYPSPGDTTVATFLVPAGNYDVDLLGFKQFDDESGNTFNSAVVFATTGTNQNVEVNKGEITEVNFNNDAADNGVLSNFDLSFDANLEFQESSAGNKKRPLNVILKGNNASGLADRIFESGTDASLGGIGIDPDEITQGDRSSARDNQDFTSRTQGTAKLTTDKFNLPPGQYKKGEASVLLQLRIDDKYIDTDNQNPVYLYNNLNGTAATDISLFEEGDGGIIVII
jgi:hypothetical protein